MRPSGTMATTAIERELGLRLGEEEEEGVVLVVEVPPLGRVNYATLNPIIRPAIPVSHLTTVAPWYSHRIPKRMAKMAKRRR